MRKIKNNIRLLSIHIPKTAGSSFQKSLETIYGNGAFKRLDYTLDESKNSLIAKNQTSQSELEKLATEGTLDPGVTVLHGHIHFKDFKNAFEINEALNVITWLRDPVERVISNYNYLRERFESESNLSPKAQKLFNRLVISITDFARLPRDLHMYHDYLNGLDLTDFSFIGFTERYDDDLIRLSKLLKWPSTPSFHINQTKHKPFQPTEKEMAELQSICQNNIEIYNAALKLKSE